jgi:hypothetical protein
LRFLCIPTTEERGTAEVEGGPFELHFASCVLSNSRRERRDPSNWLIVVSGKRGKYRLIPMNSIARVILWPVSDDRSQDAFVYEKNMNGINEYWIDKGSEGACDRAGVPFGSVKQGGSIWHDCDGSLQSECEHIGVHDYDIQDLLGHSNPGSNEGLRARLAISLGSSGREINETTRSGRQMSPKRDRRLPHLSRIGRIDVWILVF